MQTMRMVKVVTQTIYRYSVHRYIQWNLVSSNIQGNPKKVPLKECSTYPKCSNIIHKMAILQQCYVYVSAKLFCGAKMSVAFVLLLFELLFGLTLPLSKPLT